MTSNAGSNLNNNSIGFGKTSSTDKAKIQNALKDTFRPEFLNRVDEIVVFDSLNKEQLIKITELMLNDTRKALLNKNITLDITSSALEYLLEKGTDMKFGARPLRRAIQRYVEDEISEMILKGEIIDGNHINLDFTGNTIVIKVV